MGLPVGEAVGLAVGLVDGLAVGLADNRRRVSTRGVATVDWPGFTARLPIGLCIEWPSSAKHSPRNWQVSKQCDWKQSQTLFCSLSLIVCIPGQLDLYKSGCNCNDNDKRVQVKLLIKHNLH